MYILWVLTNEWSWAHRHNQDMEHLLHPKSHHAPLPALSDHWFLYVPLGVFPRTSCRQNHTLRTWFRLLWDSGLFCGSLFILRPSNTPLYERSTLCLSVHQFKDTWVVPTVGGYESGCHKHLCVGFVPASTSIPIPVEVRFLVLRRKYV